MAKERRKNPVRLFCAIMYNNNDMLCQTQKLLEDKWGDYTEGYNYQADDFTRYYIKEMGNHIYKKFISFNKMVIPEESYAIKHFTNEIEKQFLDEKGNRRINIDPGYLSLPKIVLFSAKNFSHRIYIGKGIWAEVTLYYSKPTFKAYPWTFPDYKSPEALKYFNSLRDIYKIELEQYLSEQ